MFINLNQIQTSDVCKVGNKAFKLAQLKSDGFKIKDGFCVTVDFFEYFLKENGIEQEIERLDRTSGNKHKEKLIKKIKHKIPESNFPSNFPAEFEIHLKTLETSLFAIRSSATCEDDSEASFAGQFQSFLDVERKDAAEKVKEVWSSAFSKNIIYYIETVSLTLSQIKMAVLVMEMVKADKAGVVFTHDVISGDENLLTIEGAPGLGTKVVDGAVVPDHIVVNKKTNRIERKSRIDVLSKDEILCLKEVALKIEKKYETPQDIEWAIEDGVVWILQTRPITHLRS